LTTIGLLAAALQHASPARADDSDYGAAVTDAATIMRLVTGHTLSGTIDMVNHPWAEYFCNTGTSVYVELDEVSRGNWRVKNGKLCFTYDTSHYQDELCFDAYAKPDGHLTFVDRHIGPPYPVFRSDRPIAGDPYNLARLTADNCHGGPGV
jgi:hypothetical protein